MAKQVENQGDERLENVESALSKTELFIEKNQKVIWTVLGIIVAIVLIIFGVKKFYLDPRSAEADSQIFMAQKYFEKEAYENALNGDGNCLGFLDIIDEYGSTKSGNLAAYYAGISYMKLGKYNEALTYLKKFKGKDSIIAPLALGAMGDAYMELNDMQNAANYYNKAANKAANSFTSPMFYLKEGMTYEIMGNNAKALNAYKTLKKEFPLSNEAYEISKNIANLEEKMK
jgi:Uncharacterized protein conserved in bacteria